MQPYINKSLSGFLRLDINEAEYGCFTSLGLFLMFENENLGVSVLTDNVGAEITCNIKSRGEFNENKLDGFGYVHEPPPDDTLSVLIDKELKEIKTCLYDENIIGGDNFVLLRGKLQAIIFKFEDCELIVKNAGDEIWTEVEKEIEIDKTEFPGTVWK